MTYTAKGIKIGSVTHPWTRFFKARIDGRELTRYLHVVPRAWANGKIGNEAGIGYLQPKDVGRVIVVDKYPGDSQWIDHIVDFYDTKPHQGSHKGAFARDLLGRRGLGETSAKGGFYVTSHCNKAHRLRDGAPIRHECRVIPVAALKAEMAGDYNEAIRLLQARPARVMRRGGLAGCRCQRARR